MIKEIFSPDDASAILSIPLSMRLPADWMVWAYSPKGNFAIKSAYRLAVAAGSVGSTGGLSNVQNQKKKIWKNLWQLQIPNKVRSFAWRASKNIPPTKDNLYRRKITEDPLCVVCGCEPESSGHILWDCEKTREVWKLTGIPFDTHGRIFPEFIDLL